MSEEIQLYEYNSDSPEDIQKCLECTRPECVNCLSSHAKNKEAIRNVNPINDEEFMKLYNQGMTDGDIAFSMHRSRGKIRTYRNSKNLPPNTLKGTSPDTPFDEALFFRMYADGRSDRQIARAMGVTKTRVNNFRLSQGLSPNFKKNKKVENDD